MWHLDPNLPPAVKHRRQIIGHTVVGVILVAVFAVGLFIGRSTDAPVFGAANKISLKNTSDRVLKQVDFQQFWGVWDKIQAKSVKRPLEDAKLFRGALQGMVAALDDPYSIYFTPEIARQFQEDLEGTFAGIGAEIGAKKERIVIITPLPETPAERAGLRPGDFILTVNGETTVGLSVEEVVKKIRGPAGSEVKLVVERAATQKPLEFTIKRAQIQLQSVTYKLLPNKIALISLNSFNDQTETQFNTAVQNLLADGAQGIILDVRNNPGGYFDVALRVASEWLDEGDLIVIEKGATANERQEFKSTGTHRLTAYPTAVLINEGSASAAEILAGALRDHQRARIIGSQSFGKGSVQEFEQLPDGSALKLTVALWFTPNDQSINETGIEPEIKIAEPISTETQSLYVRDPNKDVVIQRALQYLRTQK